MHTDNITVTEEPYMAVRSYLTSIGGIALSALPVQFRLAQLDHRGGFCDCWGVVNLTVTPPNGQATELSYVPFWWSSMIKLNLISNRYYYHISVRYAVGTPQKLSSHFWRQCPIRY